MEEKYLSAPGRRVLKAGSISVGDVMMDCTVRTISDSGATLEALTPLYIPDRFKLVIERENLIRRCRVIWRLEKRMGVVFD
jgi:PilZ domain